MSFESQTKHLESIEMDINHLYVGESFRSIEVDLEAEGPTLIHSY